MRPVPSRSSRSNALKPESKALVVFTSVLQLTAIAVVWLLAIIPAGLMALAVLLWKLASNCFSPARNAKSAPRA